LKKLSFLSKIK